MGITNEIEMLMKTRNQDTEQLDLLRTCELKWPQVADTWSDDYRVNSASVTT